MGKDVVEYGIQMLLVFLGEAMLEPIFRGVLLDYAEVEFLMATENIGSASSHYEAGIIASFENWGVAGANDYITKQGKCQI